MLHGRPKSLEERTPRGDGAVHPVRPARDAKRSEVADTDVGGDGQEEPVFRIRRIH